MALDAGERKALPNVDIDWVSLSIVSKFGADCVSMLTIVECRRKISGEKCRVNRDRVCANGL
jgi:hypothetical protein